MLFVQLSPRQAATYSYACNKLEKMRKKMSRARKTLEGVAASGDKYFAKCMHLISCESLQFENEINAQINSFNCHEISSQFELQNEQPVKKLASKDMQFICDYLDKNYIQSYKQFLKDKHISTSLKSLINNQLQLISASLTQLRLFNEVNAHLN